jgi:hypothetical protein
MQDIEPYYKWRSIYAPEDDAESPFYQKVYNDFQCTNSIYNYLIHPRWDNIGSSTLYVKVLFVDYDEGTCIIEMIGEWNDTLHNDIMYLKRNLIEIFQDKSIHKFVLILDNVLNFHGSDDCYYEEWHEELMDENGWVALLNTMEHINDEMSDTGLQYYMHYGPEYNAINWRIMKPNAVIHEVEKIVHRPSMRIRN